MWSVNPKHKNTFWGEAKFYCKKEREWGWNWVTSAALPRFNIKSRSNTFLNLIICPVRDCQFLCLDRSYKEYCGVKIFHYSRSQNSQSQHLQQTKAERFIFLAWYFASEKTNPNFSSADLPASDERYLSCILCLWYLRICLWCYLFLCPGLDLAIMWWILSEAAETQFIMINLRVSQWWTASCSQSETR